MSSPSKRGSYMSEINVTPLVDVMLVLLIIFMVTAPMMTAGLDVKLPNATAKPLPQKQDSVVITLNASGQIYLNKDMVNEASLVQRLSQMKARGDTSQVLLRADKDVTYGLVASVVAAVRTAGIQDLGLVTDPTEHLKRERYDSKGVRTER